MTAKIIDGKAVAASVQARVRDEAATLKAKYGITPGLATILVGENPASVSYVSSKQKMTQELGMYSVGAHPPAEIKARSVRKTHVQKRQVGTAEAGEGHPLASLALPGDGEARGLGLMLGVEFVKDKATKEPAPDLAKKVRSVCHKHGLLIEVGGHYVNVARFLPPLVLTERLARKGLEIFAEAVRAVEKSA